MRDPVMASPAGQGREIAWNGVQLTVPSSWEIGAIGKRHLVFENDGGVAAEIKWDRFKKPPEPDNMLKRLNEATRKRVPGGVIRWEPPRSWLAALSDYRVTGFTWKDQNMRGTGCAVGCPRCGTVSLIQFFHAADEASPPYTTRMLSSFRDHTGRKSVRWAVYGIRAELPENLALSAYRFQPGAFRLSFSGARCRMTLFRWAAAATLLKHRRLAEFAADIPDIGTAGTKKNRGQGTDCLHYELHPDHGGLAARVKNLLPTHMGHRWIRVWHDRSVNKILAVRLDARYAEAGAMLPPVAEGYASV